MDPRIAVEPGGFALALWHEDPSGQVRSAYRVGAGGAFAASQPVAAGTQGRVALGAADHGIAALQAQGGRIEAIRFDAAPPALGAVTVPTAATVGVPVAMTADATDPHGPLTFSWDFGDGTAGTGASVAHAYATAGLRTVTLTAADAAGNTVPTTRSVAVSAPATPVSNVTAASVAPSRFKVGPKRTATTARKKKPKPTPAGTTFSFTLSAPGTLTTALARLAPGRVKGNRCVTPTRKLRKARPCTRSTAAGSLTRRNLPAGKGTLAFSGRLGSKALAAGSYRATLTAANAARVKGRSRTVSFTIVAR
jgi:hypothetical protein